MRKFQEEQLVPVGELRRPFGVQGQIILGWDKGYSFDSFPDDQPRFLFVEVEGLPVPWKIEEMAERTLEEAILKLSMIDSPEEAKRHTGQRVSVTPDTLRNDTTHQLGVLIEPQHPLIGKGVYDQNGQFAGRVVEVDDYSNNVVLTVSLSYGKESLIPFNEELVLKQTPTDIHLQIAEGLLED